MGEFEEDRTFQKLKRLPLEEVMRKAFFTDSIHNDGDGLYVVPSDEYMDYIIKAGWTLAEVQELFNKIE
jgi:hypothetical protein